MPLHAITTKPAAGLVYRGCEIFPCRFADPAEPLVWEEVHSTGVSPDSYATCAEAKAAIDRYLGPALPTRRTSRSTVLKNAACGLWVLLAGLTLAYGANALMVGTLKAMDHAYSGSHLG